MIAFDRAAINARDAQALQRNALRIKHPKNVVIGNEQQVGWRAEVVIGIGEHSRVNVAVRTYERFASDLFVETQRDLFMLRIGIEVTIFGQHDFF